MKQMILIHLVNGDVIRSELSIAQDNTEAVRNVVEREMYQIGKEGYFSRDGDNLLYYPPMEIKYIEAIKVY